MSIGILVTFQRCFVKYTIAKIFEWAFSENRFSTALCPPDTSSFDPSYFEECISVRNIEVWPASQLKPETGVTLVKTRTGRPAQYDWLEATNAIWAKLYGNDLKLKSQADIERAFINHLKQGDDEPSQSTVRPFAKVIWEKFREH